MPSQVAPTGFWTLGSLIAGSMEVSANCEQCHFRKEVDLVALGERLGPDHPAMAGDLKKLLHCPECRSKRTSFTYSYRSGREEMIHGAWAGRTDLSARS